MNRRCLYHNDEEIFHYDLFIQSSCYNPEIKYSCFLVYPSFKGFSLGWSRFIKLEYHSLIKSHYILEPSSCKHIINLAIQPLPPPPNLWVGLSVVGSYQFLSYFRPKLCPPTEFLKIIFNKISILTLSAVVSTLQATCFLLAMEHRRPSRVYKLTEGLGFSTEGFPPVPCWHQTIILMLRTGW